MSTPITVAYGDGIGPEIMEATLKILAEAGAKLSIETIQVGVKEYEKGFSSGIPTSAWESIHRNKIILKGPITTPQGGGYKSLNVTMRKALGLYSNVRPVVSLHPYVKTKHENIDLVIVRENEEDLYAGIEYRLTPTYYETLKHITRQGTESIIRFAFEYAVKNNRKKVSCFSKDNIMKFTDGLFHKVFDEISAEYPNIEKDHYIIDIGSARLADRPEIFDVIVTMNLYGDIISDIAAEIAGSVGLAGSANIGDEYALFEAIHGSAPDIAGKNIANPSGLINGAVMMLVHIGQPDVAATVYNALMRTIEEGIHTGDIYDPATSKEKVGTKEFGLAVVKNLGKKPEKLKPAEFSAAKNSARKVSAIAATDRQLKGIDIFVHSQEKEPNKLAEIAQKGCPDSLKLQVVSNRGVKVWPLEGGSMPYLSDMFRLRFLAPDGKSPSHNDVSGLISSISANGLDSVKTQTLYTYDGKEGYSAIQGD